MNRCRHWRVIVFLMTCCTLGACSSAPDTKGDGAPGARDTAVTAQGASAPAGGPPQNYGGVIDTINCDVIGGWQWNSANNADKISIDMFVDGKLVGTTPANILRPDLKNVTGTENPNHGFSWPIPPALKDGKTHMVSATISGGTHEVKVWENIKPLFACSAP